MIIFYVANILLIFDTVCLLLCIIHMLNHPYDLNYTKRCMVWTLHCDSQGEVVLTGIFHPFTKITLTKRVNR